jgi:hypothetical protein
VAITAINMSAVGLYHLHRSCLRLWCVGCFVGVCVCRCGCGVYSVMEFDVTSGVE